MSGTGPLGDAVKALSRFFVGDATVEQTLDRVNSLACEAVPGAAMTGMSLLLEGKPTTAVFSDPTARDVDEAQYETGEGPCLEAFRSMEIIIVEDTRADDRFREFLDRAAERGIRSTLSMPLAVNGAGIGALNIYARETSAFDQQDVEAAADFAAQASVVLANANAYWDAQTMTQHLQAALASRATIEQAKGVIMAQANVGPDDAFDLLRRASQRENRKLRDIAAEIVARYPTPSD